VAARRTRSLWSALGVVATIAGATLPSAACARNRLLAVADTIHISSVPGRGRGAVIAYNDESRGWSNDSLRRVLLALADADRLIRRDFGPESFRDTAFLRRMDLVDSVNSVAMLEILRTHGWPGKSLVGARGASAAWLIVQHSRAPLLEEGERLMLAMPEGEVSPADLAMLIDRRLVVQKKPQRYGTQFTPFENGTTRLSPVEDPANLEARRADMGLPPMAEQIRTIERMYRVKVLPEPM
jgi:hypothetical protein